MPFLNTRTSHPSIYSFIGGNINLLPYGPWCNRIVIFAARATPLCILKEDLMSPAIFIKTLTINPLN